MKICDVRGWGYLTGGGALGLPHDQALAIQEANARLIAAAPDLYTACADWIEWLDADGRQSGGCRRRGRATDAGCNARRRLPRTRERSMNLMTNDPQTGSQERAAYPDASPWGEMGRHGSPDAYLIDPGAGSGSDRVIALLAAARVAGLHITLRRFNHPALSHPHALRRWDGGGSAGCCR